LILTLFGCSDSINYYNGRIVEARNIGNKMYVLITVSSEKAETGSFSHSSDVSIKSKALHFISIDLSRNHEVSILDSKYLDLNARTDYIITSNADGSIGFQNIERNLSRICDGKGYFNSYNDKYLSVTCNQKIHILSQKNFEKVCTFRLPPEILNPKNRNGSYDRVLVDKIKEDSFIFLYNSTVENDSGAYKVEFCSELSKLKILPDRVKRLVDYDVGSYLVLTDTYENKLTLNNEYIINLPSVNTQQPIIDLTNRKAFYIDVLVSNLESATLNIDVYDDKNKKPRNIKVPLILKE
jgi:hypothetical protein